MTATERDPSSYASDLGNTYSKHKFRNSSPHLSQQPLPLDISLSHYLKRRKKISNTFSLLNRENIFFLLVYCFQNFSNRYKSTTEASEARRVANSLPPDLGKVNCCLGSFWLIFLKLKYMCMCSTARMEYAGHGSRTHGTHHICDVQTDLSGWKGTFAICLVRPKHGLSVNRAHNTLIQQSQYT